MHDLLNDEPDITVIGEAGTAAQALVRVPALRPQVAVLDVHLSDGDGVSVCRELRSRMPELACLMLTSFDDEEALLDSITAGASGYVLKQIQDSDLVSAVRTVARGQSLLGLTDREREILALVGEGLTNRQTGQRLFLNGFGRIGRNYLRCVLERAETAAGTPPEPRWRPWRSTTSPRRRRWIMCWSTTPRTAAPSSTTTTPSPWTVAASP